MSSSTQSQEVAQRTPQQQLAVTIEGDYFREQIAKALPENVTVDRFQRALLTSIMQDPDVAKADHQSVILAAIRCAQDGLLPDGRQAAIAVFGGKATYMPMIGGLRKALADYGWTLRTRVVRVGDVFEFSEEPPVIKHVPAPTGDGALVYAYAIATHRDGRRMQRVVFPHEIEKRKAVAKTKNVWNQWPAEMWEKSAGHMLFDEIPLEATDPERDRLARIVAGWEQDPSTAVDAIYGPERDTPAQTAGTDSSAMEQPADGDASAEGAASGGSEQAGGDTLPAAGPSPDEDPSIEFGEPEPQLTSDEPALHVPAAVVERAAQTVIESQGLSIDAILQKDGADEWILWGLRNLDDEQRAALELVVRERLPEVWAQHTEVA